MDSPTILVFILFAGVVALLIWFETTFLRNEASKEAKSAGVGTLPQLSQATIEPTPDNKRAALPQRSKNAKEFIMTDRSIIVTDGDVDRLRRLVRALKYSLFRDQRQLELLDQTLESAEVRPQGRVPKDVVRMNSRVRVLDFDTRRKGMYTLVFPEEANISQGFISVLAPLGIALLGRRRGDVIEAKVPGGIRRLRVEHVRYGSEITKKRAQTDGSTRRKLRSGQLIPGTILAA